MPPPAPSTPTLSSLDARPRSLFLLLVVSIASLVPIAAARLADHPPLTAILSSPSGAIPIGKTYISGGPAVPATLTTTSAPLDTESAAQDSETGVAHQSASISGSFDAPALPSTYEQMVQKTTAAIVTLSSLIAYVTINSAVRAVKPSLFVWYEEDQDEESWIASSPHWLDRKACRWFGVCGATHFHPFHPRLGYRKSALTEPAPQEQEIPPWRDYWGNETDHPEEAWDETERSLRHIPDYVLEYAPLVHLYSLEQFWPCDIAEHLWHITPMLNYTPISSQSDHPTLRNLDQLNQWESGYNVFLTSNDNVENHPSWMGGEKNIPSPPDKELEQSWADWDGRVDGAFPEDTPENRAKWFDTQLPLQDREAEDIPLDKLGYLMPDEEQLRDELRKRYGGEPISIQELGGRSEAPAILLTIDKGNGILDAFWFYFYSFNLGNEVFNVRFGNHIGDWEHCLVRFHYGKPKALFFSAHSGGEAYSYEAVEKIGQRPVIYSATGTHAMYATPGEHPYILPGGILHDRTDRGPLWDPLLNSHMYTYDHVEDTLRASTRNPTSPTEWFDFTGHWGDKFYPLRDGRQYRFAGQYHYVNGPLGPKFKHLDRHKVCQGPDEAPCVIKDFIGEKKRAKRWSTYGPGNPNDNAR